MKYNIYEWVKILLVSSSLLLTACSSNDIDTLIDNTVDDVSDIGDDILDAGDDVLTDINNLSADTINDLQQDFNGAFDLLLAEGEKLSNQNIVAVQEDFDGVTGILTDVNNVTSIAQTQDGLDNLDSPESIF